MAPFLVLALGVHGLTLMVVSALPRGAVTAPPHPLPVQVTLRSTEVEAPIATTTPASPSPVRVPRAAADTAAARVLPSPVPTMPQDIPAPIATAETPAAPTSVLASVLESFTAIAGDNPQAAPEATRPAPAASALAVTPKAAINQPKHIEAFISQRMQRAYPPLARRNGWQGDVVVAIRVDTNGHIDEAHIATSSGYAALDISAVTAIRNVGVVTDYHATQAIEAHIPVSYRLTEN